MAANEGILKSQSYIKLPNAKHNQNKCFPWEKDKRGPWIHQPLILPGHSTLSFNPHVSIGRGIGGDTKLQMYVVVQFYPWLKFYFLLFLRMKMYDNEFETKTN